MEAQSAKAVVMIRPCRFFPNPETALDNAFQQAAAIESEAELNAHAQAEFDRAVEKLKTVGVTVHVFDDTPLTAKPVTCPSTQSRVSS